MSYFDREKQQAYLCILFDGAIDMEPSLLSAVIRDMAKLVSAAVKEKDPDAAVRINEATFKHGCFELRFTAIYKNNDALLVAPANPMELAASAADAVRGVFEYIKHCMGKPAARTTYTKDGKAIVVNCNGDIGIVEKSSVIIANTVNLQPIYNIIRGAHKHFPDGNLVVTTPTGTAEYTPRDKTYMGTKLSASTIVPVKITVETLELIIEKVDLERPDGWAFNYRGTRISRVRIEDDGWMNAVKVGDLAMRNGDSVRAVLERSVEVTNEGVEIGTPTFAILRVMTDIVPAQKQMSLFEE